MDRLSNKHHVFFDRRSWNQDGTTKRLRNDERTQIILPVWIHNELHAFCDPIPPESTLARFALTTINAQPKYYDNLDRMKALTDTLFTLPDAYDMAEGLHDQLPFLIIGTKALKRSIQ